MKASSVLRNVLLLVINGLIVVATFFVVIAGVLDGAGAAQAGESAGFGYFIAFTSDSNVLAAMASAVMVVFALNNLIEKRDEMPRWAVLFQFIATSGVLVTFVTAAAFLAPVFAPMTGSYFAMFAGGLFFTHFLTPVLSAVSFILLTGQHRLSFRTTLLGLLPVVVYGAVYITLFVTGVWPDFYGFTLGRGIAMIPVSMAVFLGVNLLLSRLAVKGHNAVIGKSSR